MDKRRTIIIDDDPTGCQTVRDVPILLDMDEELLRATLRNHKELFILTNTRAMDSVCAGKVSRELCSVLYDIAVSDGYDFSIISRSDSTLRGHVREELEPIMETFPGHGRLVLAPAFFECGRVTEHDIHYLLKDGSKTAVGLTEFASDPTFGYRNSNLRLWIEEVSGGRFKANDCVSLNVETCDFDILSQSGENSIFIVNASCYEELDTLVDRIKKVEAGGLRFTFRTAASFVRSYLGQTFSEYVRPATNGNNGLIVVGSYTELTTRQVNYLKENGKIKCFELDVNDLSEANCKMLAKEIDTALSSNDCLLYTSRTYCEPKEGEVQLDFAERVTSALCSVVKSLSFVPGFIMAKGGITSLTVARDALEMRQTVVLGQIAAGIPVWLDGNANPFVVFPGNVGEDDTLYKLFSFFVNCRK